MIKFNLNGKWELNKAGDDKVISAVVPGDVYKDLLDNGCIVDPFYRDNESRLQWIGESDWIYCRDFSLSDELLAQKNISLVCDGLDTLASVSLNGHKLAPADNMFRQWRWDISDIARKSNRIEIIFSSTLPYIESKQQVRRLSCMGTEDMRITSQYGWIRKQQCNYGWDWGIKAVTCGIWRDIRIEAFDAAALDDVMITQRHLENGEVDLDIQIDAKTVGHVELSAKVSAIYNGKTVAVESCQLDDNGKAKTTLKIENPKLWWLINMGEQNLYDIKVELLHSEQVIDEQTKRIGLRVISLDRHKDQWGESFQFTINGVPFFAKGANWIPADGILSRLTSQRYRKLVADAAKANMNMIRVWGGGIYEDEAFYDACDELGICIWQDFMFACSTYPAFNDEFMRNVEQEAIYNVKRLHHRACLALWCGNNEIEMKLISDEWTEKTMSWADYGKLFDKLLADVVAEHSPTVDYWPGSPHTPVGDRSKYNDPNSGDAHLWAVWHGRQPFEWYRTCEHRFNSEFGFQSFPQPSTVEKYTDRQDRNIASRIMEYHQRFPKGNETIMHHMLEWFRMPTGFENTIWLSQVQQGMAMKYACEHWRRSMPRGMGTLYWQINDTWPVASWSSIDYYGNWKALHYMACKFFAPLLISGVEDIQSGSVEINITSDLLTPVDAIVKWKATDLDGNTLLQGKKDFLVPPQCNTIAQNVCFKDIIAQRNEREFIVWLELNTAEGKVSENMVLFTRPKYLELAEDVCIDADISKISDKLFEVSLKADKPVLWCHLNLADSDLTYSDNFFNLCSGESKIVRIETMHSIDLNYLKDNLIIESLKDTY